MLAEEARKRQVAHLKHQVTENKGSASLAPFGANDREGKASEVAAKLVGVSPRTVERAAVVRRDNPREFERIKAGETTPPLIFRVVYDNHHSAQT